MEYMEFAMDCQIEGAQSENARLADENARLEMQLNEALHAIAVAVQWLEHGENGEGYNAKGGALRVLECELEKHQGESAQ